MKFNKFVENILAESNKDLYTEGMNKELKYIIIKDRFEVPIIFSALLNHKTVAGNLNVISAGFCTIESNNQVSCYGESVSLNIKSRKEDSSIIENTIGQAY